MARIVWSPAARRRLDDIVEYIGRDSPSAAVAMHRAILLAVGRLGMWPESGPWVGARHPELAGLDRRYRIVVVRPYVVFYRLEGDDVYVLTIQHGAQLPPSAKILDQSS